MNLDLARIKQEARVLVNRARTAAGLQPILFFPASIRNTESHCVIASTLPHGQKYQAAIATAWETEVVPEMVPSDSDLDWYVHYDNHGYVKLPEKITQFINLFNEGHYPELELVEPALRS